MSDPRNVAHAKKVTQEKKHQGTEARPADGPVAQPGKKQPAAKKKTGLAESAVVPTVTAASESAMPGESLAPKPPAALEGSLAVTAQRDGVPFARESRAARGAHADR